MPPLQGSSQEDLLQLKEAYAQALESQGIVRVAVALGNRHKAKSVKKF